MDTKPVVLVILDGWGKAPAGDGNAIALGNTPNMDRYERDYPATQLRTWGEDVGLPEGQMGNSEVGHMNIGAGFVVYQSITRIDKSIRESTFTQNRAFSNAINHARENNSKLHFIGLIGSGGVHAHHRHWAALIELAGKSGLPDVVTHAITDGRDTEPTSGLKFMQALNDEVKQYANVRVGTLCGRYFAMDRDKRWDRTKRAWDAIVRGQAHVASDPIGVIRSSYENQITDEFMEPTIIDGQDATIGDGDAVIFVNFRADRVRQIVSALSLPNFDEFDRVAIPSNLYITTMTEYEKDYPVDVAFPPEAVTTPLAKVISDAGLKQFHTAETEKYAHVTYFLNGGREEPFPGEDREMVPSPKVATYDLQPEMSAQEVTNGAVRAIASREYKLVVINYANGDMVGHTGDIAATVKAVETVDRCLGQIVHATLAADGIVVATADHGNAEEMLIPGTNDIWTAHTMNPVPFIIISGDDCELRNVSMVDDGRLADIAPTLLAILGIEPAPEMTGNILYS
jgi:2,3-bisphosphoglycerate-independent phosphoglycerate mutase